MEGEECPQLLDLIPGEGDRWAAGHGGGREKSPADEKKLELRLGPPGQEWSSNGYLNQKNQSGVWYNQQQQIKGTIACQFLQTNTVMAKESSQPCSTIMAGVNLQQSGEKKGFFPPPTAVSQKRTAPGPVVGWPPIRSFRKNLATSSSKSAIDSQNEAQNKKFGGEKLVETSKKGMFVKINMDGVPIGRKVDLQAYDSYEKLSSAVDKLFRGLLAAQRDCSSMVKQEMEEEEKPITGVLDGKGEYTLVYEDNEGDRMLVGDVPWHMFVSTVKRLRVLKSSEVSALTLGCGKNEKC